MSDFEAIKVEVVAGNDAEDFVGSELGKIVLGMAEQDAKAVMQEFSEVDASDLSKVRDLQVRLKVALRFDSYLAELVTRGREAMEAYKQQQEG